MNIWMYVLMYINFSWPLRIKWIQVTITHLMPNLYILYIKGFFVYKFFLLHLCHPCFSSSLGLYFLISTANEETRVEFYLTLCLRVWRNIILEIHGRKSMLWLVTIYYRLIKARGEGLSPAQFFIWFDCKHSCKQTSLRLCKVEGHVAQHWQIFLSTRISEQSLYVTRYCDAVAVWINHQCSLCCSDVERHAIFLVIFSRLAITF